MRFILLTSILTGMVSQSYAHHATDQDSIAVSRSLERVDILANRATRKSGTAYTNISKEELQKRNLGKDIPYLLSLTPSAITTSDAGTGIGYTTLRVRGTDATRINVTINGVPLNDSESHCLYWVNVPDLASSLKDVQIQRGAGTSTNGAGAFGASVNMLTDNAAFKPSASFQGTYGSFNTHKEMFRAATGLINDHWTFDARLSNIGSDGYIDRASSHLQSFFTQGAFYSHATSVKLLVFGGKEKTYHAWNYASKEEMEQYGRTFNSCGMYTDSEGNIRFYENQNDIYNQLHSQLLINHTFNAYWKLNAALHYTHGNGYYEEYKPESNLTEYGLKSRQDEQGNRLDDDLIRRKQMDNDFAGGLAGIAYRKGPWDIAFGGAFNRYHGKHFGRVIWVKQYEGDLDPLHPYYDSKAFKNDGNLYVKGSYDITPQLSVYADVQYRHISYQIEGENDKYNPATGKMQELNVNEHFNFCNPKAGLNWEINKSNRLYASFAVAQKEPTRNNYTEMKQNRLPRPERLLDYELGYQFQNRIAALGANLYFMDYKDQLILTGEVNEIGEALTDNVPKSYRLGVELTGSLKPVEWFRWDLTATWSRNRIVDFTETLYDEQMNPWVIHHGSTPIAFSPDWTANNRFTFSYRQWEAALSTQYVGGQYMTNAGQKDQMLDAYCVSNLDLSYTFHPRKIKELILGVSVYNLFNAQYENNGYAGSYYETVDGNKVRQSYAGYAAQAGIHALGHVSISF